MNQRRRIAAATWAVLAVVLGTVVGVGAWQRWAPRPQLPVLATVPDFAFTERSGRLVTRADLAGHPVVVDFVFTRCTLVCPLMTSRLAKVGRGLREGLDFRRVSISVDPEHDNRAELTAFADRYGAPGTWWFLTGGRDETLTLARDGFKLAVNPATGDPTNPIGHSSRFVLVDGRGQIRGYYDAMSHADLAQLERDLLDLTR